MRDEGGLFGNVMQCVLLGYRPTRSLDHIAPCNAEMLFSMLKVVCRFSLLRSLRLQTGEYGLLALHSLEGVAVPVCACQL